jgi:hypothetical protein
MMGLTQKGTFVLRGRSLIALCVGGDQWRRWANFIVSSRFPYHLKRTPQKMCATFLTLPGRACSSFITDIPFALCPRCLTWRQVR